ncbi:diguanylate cyclase domain-containing protein [Kineococcus sp. SYSU DK006]|uniref:diguanylate cyclase domain-containing protein n=1 Tax=Kineococcus sp. SYSU DK006 TaxID=3383127 RepID=UPI003D7E0B2E
MQELDGREVGGVLDVVGRWSGAARAGGARQRQDGVTRTRSLFFALALVALLVVLVPFAVLAPLAHALAALPAAALLAASWWYGHSRRRVPWACDVLDPACFAALVVLSPVPTSILSITFSTVWFRSMYGSTPRAFARLALLQVAVGTGLALWPLVHGGHPAPLVAAVYSAFAMMVVNTGVIRGLAAGLRGRDEAAARESVVAALGADLLAVEAANRVEGMTWSALQALCATTSGLSVAVAHPDGDEFRVSRSCGPHPPPVPGGLLPAAPPGATSPEHVQLPGGDGRGWSCLRFPSSSQEVWLLVGGPRRTVEQGLPAVQAVAHHAALALRNAASRDALRTQARTDPLTGLPNRAAFQDAVDRAVLRADGAGSALLFIDLDGFKAVNDDLGHAAGDALLRTVAARLRGTTREGDLCARLGGDEFAVLLTAADEQEATAVGRRVVAVLSEPVRFSGVTARVGASVGVALHEPGGDHGDGEALVRAADAAMYAAKAAGKGCVRLHGRAGEAGQAPGPRAQGSRNSGSRGSSPEASALAAPPPAGSGASSRAASTAAVDSSTAAAPPSSAGSVSG